MIGGIVGGSTITRRFGCTSSNQSFALLMLFGSDEAETGDGHEALEVSGPSHRLGLSGANKTMLHLLKKAKVQLIKIDQQKQLKLSQVRVQDFLVLKIKNGKE